jgi:4-hydroxy-2-oxoglutarate aldolase
LLYFRALADRSPVPVIVANRPRVTQVNLDAEAVIALAVHPNIAGVLEASGDVAKILLVVKQVRKNFAVLCGDEQRLWECLKAGAAGAILPFASAAPYVTISVWEAFRTREEDAGLDWQARMAHPAELVTSRYGAAGLKVAMDVNGYYGGPPRLPSVVLTPAERDEVADAFRDLKG